MIKAIRKHTAKALGAALLFAATTCPAADRAPNILFILVDDMGWSDPGFLGGDIETPNLDRLAQEGTVYPRFFNHAKCEPSRASLLTGVHFHRQTWDHVVRNFRGVSTIAEALKKAGYFTACAGKWHLPEHPVARGFDRFYGLLGGAGNHMDPDGRLKLDDIYYLHKEVWLDDQPTKVTDEDYYSTDAVTDYALEFLQDRPGKGKSKSPFFLYMSYRAPHWPLQAPAETIAKYTDRYSDGWDALRASREAQLRNAGIFPDGWSLPPRDPSVGDWADWPDKEDAARCMAVHAAMVDRLDQQIGRLLEHLEKTGELDNTLICFTSDNGVAAEMSFDRTPEKPAGPVDSFRVLPLGFCDAVNTPFLKYKKYHANGGIASPFIVRWPGKIPAGLVNHKPINILDMMPTFLEVAGATYPGELRSLDGQSLFSGEARPMFFQLKFSKTNQKAVIDWPWKAWLNAKEGWKLFNLEVDPTETKDRADQRPETLNRLVSQYDQFDRLALADQKKFKQTKASK